MGFKFLGLFHVEVAVMRVHRERLFRSVRDA